MARAQEQERWNAGEPTVRLELAPALEQGRVQDLADEEEGRIVTSPDDDDVEIVVEPEVVLPDGLLPPPTAAAHGTVDAPEDDGEASLPTLDIEAPPPDDDAELPLPTDDLEAPPSPATTTTEEQRLSLRSTQADTGDDLPR